MRVIIPSQLQSYCAGVASVEAAGTTVDEALLDLDQRFPGIRFRIIDEQGRIRRHMRIFVGQEAVREVGATLNAGDEILIFGALSGG